jgi:hypothetical protein
MKKDLIKKLLPLYITGDLTRSEKELVENGIKENSEFKDEFESLKKLYDNITSIKVPEHGGRLKRLLHDDLRVKITSKRKPLLRLLPVTASISLIVVILLIAFTLFNSNKIQETESWLVQSIPQVEFLNDYIEVPIDYMTNDNLERVNDALTTSISNISSLDNYLTFSPGTLFSNEYMLTEITLTDEIINEYL